MHPDRRTLENLERTRLLADVGVADPLEAILVSPPRPRALVVFPEIAPDGVHPAVSRSAARRLRAIGLATLSVNLRSPRERETCRPELRVSLDDSELARRLAAVVSMLRSDVRAEGLPIGYFATGAAAGAALSAASAFDAEVFAVVAHRARLDLPRPELRALRAPTLFLLHEEDWPLAASSERALREIGGPAELRWIPGPTTEFDEFTTAVQVARLAATWFGRCLEGAGERPAAGATERASAERPKRGREGRAAG